MKRFTIMAALAVATLAPAVASAAIVDGGFEGSAGSITNANGYCYFSGAFNPPACGSGASWTGAGVTSGLQLEGNTAWPGTPTPDGSAYGFIQSGYGAPGSIAQTFSASAGRYVLNWLDAGRRGSSGNQAYNVILDGVTVFNGLTSTDQAFTARTTGPLVLSGNSHSLTFQALASGGDNAAFIDAVSISSVPEPTSWAMMVMGIGMAGGAMRRRRAKGTLAIA